ncbi:hypothetical protein CLPU_3c00430 [Gottschalkia purinilytica]|uniref:Uncharacterized protein n=1 Tax=Gottschalkia purinilytica TaxID=1503 RepID=A0A0L0WCX6_GOTPU|nr:hypothetical protein [Gottschalkia purinilytica]KNF09265.1 hypothetical protein CLPU_3c00430 [Gottschalkia purinilytica]
MKKKMKLIIASIILLSLTLAGYIIYENKESKIKTPTRATLVKSTHNEVIYY